MANAKNQSWHLKAAKEFGKIVSTSRTESVAVNSKHPGFHVYFSNWTEVVKGKKRRLKIAQVVEHPSKGLGRDLKITVEGTFPQTHSVPNTHSVLPVSNALELSNLVKVALKAHKALAKHAK